MGNGGWRSDRSRDDSRTAIERAFELARSGHCRSVSEILRRLPAADRLAVEAQLKEHDTRRQLILVCSEAWLATQ
jgi:hypothetical protein